MAIWSQSVEGLDKLLDDFRKLPDDAINDLIPATTRVGQAILLLAQARVPSSKYGKSYYGKMGNKGKESWNHAPGLLKKSIRLKKPRKYNKKKWFISASVGFSAGAAYGVPLELGHKLVFFGTPMGTSVKERPFLRNSADDNKQYAINETTEAINKTLEKFGRKG